jgi:hypothetical protein
MLRILRILDIEKQKYQQQHLLLENREENNSYNIIKYLPPKDEPIKQTLFSSNFFISKNSFKLLAKLSIFGSSCPSIKVVPPLIL